MKPECKTKQKLLDTAMEMIWESSYGSVSVDDICTKAGVKKGSFYHAFKSKSDLAVAAFERHWEVSKRPLLDSIFSTQIPALERLEKYCRLIIDDQLKKFRSFGKMLGCPFCSVGCELSTQDENIRQKLETLGDRSERYLESAIRDLVTEGLVESKDPTELSQEVHSYITGAMMQAKIENSPKHVERMWQGVMRLLNVKSLETAIA